MGIDEPLNETDYGMANPYRQGLNQFLEQEESKEKKERDVEIKAREEREAALKEQERLEQEEEEKAIEEEAKD